MKLFKHRPTEGYQTKLSIINRRKAILTTAKYTFFGLIGLRLLWLQVFQRNKYSILSDRNRFKEWKIAAERGLILDRFNNKIAENRQLYNHIRVKTNLTDHRENNTHNATEEKLRTVPINGTALTMAEVS